MALTQCEHVGTNRAFDARNPVATNMNKRLATIQVSAESNGYAVWHSGQFDSLHSDYRTAMQRARELVRQYAPDVSDVMFAD
jgi:hypothetical protein